MCNLNPVLGRKYDQLTLPDLFSTQEDPFYRDFHMLLLLLLLH